MNLKIPELCLVVLVGPSGCGKSTFARTHFKGTEVLSSDFCRGLVSDDENSQDATTDAFAVLHFVAAKRLTRGLLTVVDATNVQPEARRPLVQLARDHDVLPVAIVLNLDEKLCHERNRQRPDRDFGAHVVRQQSQQLRRSLRGLEREGFRYVYELKSLEEVAQVTVERQPLWNNRKWDRGPFDIIGDVHGCFDELVELLTGLGYTIREGEAPPEPRSETLTPTRSRAAADSARLSRSTGRGRENGSAGASPSPSPYLVTPPPGRKAVFLGDLVDRGPKVPQVLKLAMSMVQQGHGLCLPGNHDVKLVRKLRGRDVQITHGLAESLSQLEEEPAEFRQQTADFLDNLVSHYVLDDGRLVVAHAGMKQAYIGRASGRVREFSLYGETMGESDEFGLPVRYNWAAEYRGAAHVVYGHTPVPEADWLNRTINIDTGCVFGGKLTALRWPEKEIISVPAKQAYAEPAKPFLNPGSQTLNPLSAQQLHDDVLDIEDVIGKRLVTTRLMANVTVREENAIAALEVMSRFAANPKWLIYLPPTMSPTETSDRPGLLEHPQQAFDYFRANGVGKVICQEKHMGSRAVVIVCRDEQAAVKRFGVTNDGIGILYTRTGRRFFDDRKMEVELLAHVHQAISAAGWWDQFASDWFCLDCELMPWSAKAQELLKNQYAAVGSAAQAALPEAISALRQANERYVSAGLDSLSPILQQEQDRLIRAGRYVDAYRRYCWKVDGAGDLKLAPFHLLASEGKVHVDKDHLWHMGHMQTLAGLVASAGQNLLLATNHHLVDVTDPASVEAGIDWWEDLTGRGGEGMVVKPLEFVVRGKRGLVQPAVKCRGKEYLRIIYGPQYDAPENLSRLRGRGLGAKRSLALREFALGIESLERFVRREPLRRVHECVFGVLALESQPVDPRL